ncbi:transposase TnpA, ISL3 family protein [Cupriavidus sp. HMR-1]|uniref:ISL3 family transposase n=1 Tax=Cupriavidus sp. HMR-1 TaxID=1249621 RepID=UPI0002A43E66|nr:ISL3 family transposase [Cupriavidus sp. HMR-1]ELA01471.1 transposase TnpA, ISL3 family protein [Cupriavidus sp. HMR-1]
MPPPTDSIIPFPAASKKNMPANILNLPTYAVLAVEQNDHDYHLSVEVKQPPTHCPHCNSDHLVGFGRREQLVKDLPMHGKRVGMYVSTRRMQCRACSKTFSEALPDVDEKRAMTKRLVDWIGRQAVKRTFLSIADEVGVVEGTVRAIFRDYVSDLEHHIRFETPRWMGIDEIHLIRPRGVITNIANNTIVELLPNRNKDTVVRYFYNLEGRDRVQYVAMDMWRPYRDAVHAVLPDATIIVDKFHVVRMANDAVESARKATRENLTAKQRRALMHDRFVLLKRERDLTDQERLLMEGWTLNYPLLGEAYRLKEAFYGIYDSATPDEAYNVFSDWRTSIPHGLHGHFEPLTKAFQNWMPEILNYFEHPITNAYTESLNNLLRVMNRLGRGYSFEALRAKILFAEGAFKRTNSRPKFERRAKQRLKEEMMGYGIPDEAMEMADLQIIEKPVKAPRERAGSTQEPKIYGVDISTLARLIEEGEV